eukprot:403358884
MESKLEQLLNRFESLVNRFEQASSTGNNEVSASVSGSTNTSTSSVPKIIKEFDNEIFPKIKVLEEAATNLGGDVIQTITKEYVKMVLSQRDILQTMSQANKPADFKFLILPVSKAKNDVRALKNKDLKMQNHVQTVADGFDLFAWFAQSDIKDTLEELLKQIDFYGFKVLQLKQENDTVWYKAYKDLAKTFVDFIADRADKAVQWTGSNDNAEEVFQSQLGQSEQLFRGGAPATTSQKQQIEEVKQQTGNLFADITSGQTMNQNLVHVEKNAHKKDGSALQPIVKKEIAPKTAVGAKVEVKKDPKTEFKMNTYYIEHYGKETLKYEGDQIESNYAFAMIKCKDTNLVVDGKCKNIMLENCQNVRVVVESILANVEVINCQKIFVTVKLQIPQMAVERSNSVQVFLFESARNCKIHTTSSQSVVVNFPKTGGTDEDEWFDVGIPETFVTTIKDDKLKTEIHEQVE